TTVSSRSLGRRAQPIRRCCRKRCASTPTGRRSWPSTATHCSCGGWTTSPAAGSRPRHRHAPRRRFTATAKLCPCIIARPTTDADYADVADFADEKLERLLPLSVVIRSAARDLL